MRVVGAAWIRDGRVLAARRGPGRSRAGAWELPGGKVEPGETDAAALARELWEELRVRVTVGPLLGVGRSAEQDRVIELAAYEVTSDDEPTALEHDALAWVGPDGLDLAWAPADVPLVALVRERLSGR